MTAAALGFNPARDPMRVRRVTTLSVLAIALAAALVSALGMGAVAIAPLQVVAILLKTVGIDIGVAFERYHEAALLSVPDAVAAIPSTSPSFAESPDSRCRASSFPSTSARTS